MMLIYKKLIKRVRKWEKIESLLKVLEKII